MVDMLYQATNYMSTEDAMIAEGADRRWEKGKKIPIKIEVERLPKQTNKQTKGW